MFEIANLRQLWIGTVVIVCVAMVFAAIAVFLVFPFDLAQEVLSRALIIVFVVATPIVRFVLGTMHEKHLISVELRRLVERDRLTDVATRDFFFAQMEDRANNFGVSLMIDIDHFKAINDKHGHLIGDEVIKCVADALRNELRERDVVCRFGGEEFVVFLYESSEEAGWQVAERMRQAVENIPKSDQFENLQVTVSVGASMKVRLEQIEDAIKRADDCLYRAKRAGRNRTVVDWERPSRSNQRSILMTAH